MRIDIKSISHCTGASLTIETEISPSEMTVSFQGYRLTRPLSFAGQLQNTGDGVLVLTGRIRTGYEGDCARCLVPVQAELDVTLSDVFRPKAEEGEAEDENSYPYEGWKLDISQAIRDNLVLAMPQRLFCREDCSGICPDCGNNLNEKDCGCAAARASNASPFDQLKKLL